MDATKVPVIYWHEKGHDATRIYQKLSMRLGHTLPAYSTIPVGSENSSEALISLEVHQAAGDYPMIVSTLELRLLLSNISSTQCVHCIPPSGIHTQQYNDICIPQALLCTI
jgi:hypothetical protein